MRILIVGTGLSGCALGRLLIDSGHDVRLIERKAFVCGLDPALEDIRRSRTKQAAP